MTQHTKASALTGRTVRLDRRTEADDVINPDEVKDPIKLALILSRLIQTVNELRKRFAPRRLDWEDQTVAASTLYTIPHGFGGRVRWWVVGWVPTTIGTNDDAKFFEDSTTDATKLVLKTGSTTVGKVSIRVEESG